MTTIKSLINNLLDDLAEHGNLEIKEVKIEYFNFDRRQAQKQDVNDVEHEKQYLKSVKRHFSEKKYNELLNLGLVYFGINANDLSRDDLVVMLGDLYNKYNCLLLKNN